MAGGTTTSEAGAWRLAPALGAVLATIWFARFIAPVAQGEIPELVLQWVPALGIEFAFRLDGLALAFALLICGIGALVFLYAATYFRSDRRLGSLLLTLVLFAVSMLGMVVADDAITFFVFWEGTTITSWLLVGFDHERGSARAAALQALLVTALGGLALLAGLVIMSSVAGSWRLSEMNAAGDIFRDSAAYGAIFWLVIIGAFSKSAQFPFHFWLPNAMAAPTPVSAYLHSATMVKAGVYLLARLSPSLGGTELWTAVLVPVGGFTMLLASVWAMRQTDLKLMLAFTTVMALSLMVMLLGLGTPEAITAAMVFLLVHAFYKAGLFLAVGMIDKGAGTREYPLLAELKRPDDSDKLFVLALQLCEKALGERLVAVAQTDGFLVGFIPTCNGIFKRKGIDAEGLAVIGSAAEPFREKFHDMPVTRCQENAIRFKNLPGERFHSTGSLF